MDRVIPAVHVILTRVISKLPSPVLQTEKCEAASRSANNRFTYAGRCKPCTDKTKGQHSEVRENVYHKRFPKSETALLQGSESNMLGLGLRDAVLLCKMSLFVRPPQTPDHTLQHSLSSNA